MDTQQTGRPAEDPKQAAGRDLLLQQYNANWGEICLLRSIYKAHKEAKMTFQEIGDVLGCAKSWAYKLFKRAEERQQVLDAEWKGAQDGAEATRLVEATQTPTLA